MEAEDEGDRTWHPPMMMMQIATETVSEMNDLWSSAVGINPPPPSSEIPEAAQQPCADQQQSPPPPPPLTAHTSAHTSKPINMATSGLSRPEDRCHAPERKRRHSNDSHDSSTKASESAADDNRDDDDDNDDDDDDAKLPSHDVDPERLKAFNLFVRLFIDENLDRSVPISKQPKDKIQAILEACDRQFSEFHDRARKRIRTYLKSCRRLRRTKDVCGIDQIRPTPPHLTSAIAEGILAQACENENNNAKRMRMGLEPLPAVTIGSHVSPKTSASTPPTGAGAVGPPTASHRPSSYPCSKLERASPIIQPSSSQGVLVSPSKAPPEHLAEKPRGPQPLPLPLPTAPLHNCYEASSIHSYPLAAVTSTAPTRNAYSTVTHQRPAHYHHHHHHQNNPPPASQVNNNAHLQTGPTDLSVKSSSSSAQTNGSSSQLSSSEMATIRQLIAGYRESAAFLYRSADELEQLLIHHK